LALIYIKTVFALYNIDHLGDDERNIFLEVVQDADLSAPLEKDIFAIAQKRFAALIGAKVAPQPLP
jgi:hypothetical protein